jgi:hypothetical protein
LYIAPSPAEVEEDSADRELGERTEGEIIVAQLWLISTTIMGGFASGCTNRYRVTRGEGCRSARYLSTLCSPFLHPRVQKEPVYLLYTINVWLSEYNIRLTTLKFNVTTVHRKGQSLLSLSHAVLRSSPSRTSGTLQAQQ